MNNLRNTEKLQEGLAMVELEERLEMVQLQLSEEAAASLLCDFGSVEVQVAE
ncbi:hypothetical protein JKA74_09680 [Marivirga sp. S37H4]|uniref:Uncharacterized protein n=1 Tax=Marivirga aurantiaca TaxID=2802615 RepID=A0A934WYV2_9BACT|nr:hypothetical protein [Marivirga aurantiaca]MBK6265310.1 hypothetical protein [Marivirga aurantiaca]